MPRNQRKQSLPSTSRAATQRTQVESSDESSDNETSVESRTTEDLTELVTNFVKYVLNYATTKIPIKRTDISKALNIPPKDFIRVHSEGVKFLKTIYGLDLVEVPETKSGKLYMVCSSLPNTSAQTMPMEQRRETTALFVMLAYIFMKGGDVLEENLLQFITEVPLHYTDEEKDEELKKLIKAFNHQLYIKRTKVELEGKNESEFHLSWGQRADIEFDKKKMLDTVGKIMQKSPLSFMTQYTEVYGETQEDIVMLE